MPLIRSFKISKLFGYKTINIEFKSDYTILVGENGSGKTTILNCLNYVLRKQFDELAKIPFDFIEIVWGKNGKKWHIRHNEVTAHRVSSLSMRERQIFTAIQDKIQLRDMGRLVSIAQSTSPEDIKKDELLSFLHSKGLQSKYGDHILYECAIKVVDDLVAFLFEEQVKEMDTYLTGKVLPLPTYRRIEKYLEGEELPKHQLLNIHFGMTDVKEQIEDVKHQIDKLNKEGFNDMVINLLGMFIHPQPQPLPFDIPRDKVEIVLSRLGDKLPADQKDSILAYLAGGEHTNGLIEAIIQQLYIIYQCQEHLDKRIKDFVDRCNAYLQNKRFVYNESAVTINLYSTENNAEIEDLESLSSGEKQMISMMSYLYLSQNEEKLIVLVDEPELSLSIKWQQLLLPDFVNSGKCLFLLAVTHSPFIFNNELKENAVGLHNFITNEE